MRFGWDIDILVFAPMDANGLQPSPIMVFYPVRYLTPAKY